VNRAGAPALALGLLLVAGAARAQPAVFAVDDEIRLRRQDAAAARAAGTPLDEGGGHLDLEAFRGETIAFQIALVAGFGPIQRASVRVSPFGPGVDAGGPRTEVFREHTVAVTSRSRNDARPAESLGWTPGARPDDGAMLGDVPDALIPSALESKTVDPLPLARPGEVAMFWVDVAVPDDLAAGSYVAQASVTVEGVARAGFAVRLRVLPTALPYRATSVFAYYEPARLAARIGDGGAAERQLWQLLHAHHIDALAPLADPAEARRLADAYDGSLFEARFGYDGPGRGVPPAVAALGAYGSLHDPTDASLAAVDAIAAQLRPRVADLFVYAVDEQCDSPRAADWVRALAGRTSARGVSVGQTCAREPVRQAAPIELIPAGAFGWRSGSAAAAVGKRAWIYNGHLPQTGTLLLDADPRGLIANGWIAAAAAIERWFYWESTFWDDDNPGGHGAVDPFVTAETFHNRDGDSALGDGLLVYPGRQTGARAAHNLGFPGVVASLRLKAIRRGAQDAAIIGLAVRDQPAAAARIVAQAIPAVLDAAAPDAPPTWSGFAKPRAALRALVTTESPISENTVRSCFLDLRGRLRPGPRRRPIPIAPFAAVLAVLAVLIAGRLIVRRRRL
jgi:hypothetical protein